MADHWDRFGRGIFDGLIAAADNREDIDACALAMPRGPEQGEEKQEEKCEAGDGGEAGDGVECLVWNVGPYNPDDDDGEQQQQHRRHPSQQYQTCGPEYRRTLSPSAGGPSTAFPDDGLEDGWDEQGVDISARRHKQAVEAARAAHIADLHREGAAIRAGTHPELQRKMKIIEKKAARRERAIDTHASHQRDIVQDLYKTEVKGIHQACDTAKEKSAAKILQEIRKEMRNIHSKRPASFSRPPAKPKESGRATRGATRRGDAYLDESFNDLHSLDSCRKTGIRTEKKPSRRAKVAVDENAWEADRLAISRGVERASAAAAAAAAGAASTSGLRTSPSVRVSSSRAGAGSGSASVRLSRSSSSSSSSGSGGDSGQATPTPRPALSNADVVMRGSNNVDDGRGSPTDRARRRASSSGGGGIDGGGCDSSSGGGRDGGGKGGGGGCGPPASPRGNASNKRSRAAACDKEEEEEEEEVDANEGSAPTKRQRGSDGAAIVVERTSSPALVPQPNDGGLLGQVASNNSSSSSSSNSNNSSGIVIGADNEPPAEVAGSPLHPELSPPPPPTPRSGSPLAAATTLPLPSPSD